MRYPVAAMWLRGAPLAILLLTAPAQDEDLARLLDAGRQAIDQGSYPTAIAALEKAARLAPGSAEVHALLGKAYLRDRKAHPAAAHLEKAVEAGVADPNTLLQLGAAWWELKRTADAERMFRRVLDSGAGTLVALQQLGRLLLFEGRAAEALEPLRRAVALVPDDVDLRLDFAAALEGAGREPEALAAYREAVRKAPELPRARYGLARLLLRTGKRDAAARELEVYQRLLADQKERTRREGLARARLDEGWSLFQAGRHREAAELFASLPETVESLSGLAFARSGMGDHRGAAQALERAVALAPEREDLRSVLAEERLAEEGQK
ncbi:tetratricopeptide repeat protein [bacterium]|nr:MAG: tetratricopeptide repeat protein [bacterium]